MSGVTLAVSPQPSDRITPQSPATPPISRDPAAADPTSGGLMGSLRVIQLQLVAFIIVFSASGLVPLLDLVFPAMASAYILLLSRFVFPSHRSSNSRRRDLPEIFRGSRWFRAYVMVGTTVGLFLPLAYVLGGFARGDDHAVRSATPHLFLLSFQILTENVISGLTLFSPPVRALVPMLYTVRRIFIVMDWVKDVWINKTMPANPELQDVVWHWFGRVLSLSNFVYFSVNLFCFLIPQFLPRAFEMYFMEKRAKMGEDRRAKSDQKEE